MRLFCPFEKVEQRDDGTLKVSGVASSETRDSDGEVILATAIAAALDDYRRFPAVREMHRADTAAGTALDIRVDADKRTRVEALIVDPVTCKKITTGTLRGFSVGGKVLKRSDADPSVIEALALTEISVVDRPANPEAVVTVWKADASPVEPPPEAHVGDSPEPAEPTCAKCGGKLTCAACDDAPEAAAKMAQALAEVGRREASGLLAKVAEIQRERDDLVAKLATAEAALVKRTAERDALQVKLAAHPKGALHAVPTRYVVEKADDVAGEAPEDEDADEPLGPVATAIRKVHRGGGLRLG